MSTNWMFRDLYFSAGQSPSDSYALATLSPMHPPNTSEKSLPRSSLFRGKFHHDSLPSSLPQPSKPSLPIHAAVSQPFKPVGRNPSCRVVDESVFQCPRPTFPSECLLPHICRSDTNGSALSLTRSASFESPLPPDLNPVASSRQRCLDVPVSSESPLPPPAANTPSSVPRGCLTSSVSSECPLPSLESPLPSANTLSDDSGSEEDPTIESARLSHSPTVDMTVGGRCQTAGPKLSAAARISVALSKSFVQQADKDCTKSQPRQCYLAPTTKMSMAVTAHHSKIGRRLSAALHNSRLRQQLSSSGKTYTHSFYDHFWITVCISCPVSPKCPRFSDNSVQKSVDF